MVCESSLQYAVHKWQPTLSGQLEKRAEGTESRWNYIQDAPAAQTRLTRPAPEGWNSCLETSPVWKSTWNISMNFVS